MLRLKKGPEGEPGPVVNDRHAESSQAELVVVAERRRDSVVLRTSGVRHRGHIRARDANVMMFCTDSNQADSMRVQAAYLNEPADMFSITSKV